MKHISDLFAAYKRKIKPPQSSVIKVFIEVCKEVCGLEIFPEQCAYTVSTNTLYLKTPSLIKSEIIQKQNLILGELKKRLGSSAPKQII